MNEASTPLVCLMPAPEQGGRPRTVIKIEVAPPALFAVAVVLDLSDSCATMQAELARVPRLFEGLPRGGPVWIYRLSDTRPLDEANTLAHLCDGSVSLMRWAADRGFVERAQATGSYLGPTLEAVVARAARDRIQRVKVLVVTDGELLDVGAVEVPPAIELIGLTATRDPSRQAHWQRVVPHGPLCTLADRALDGFFRAAQNPFHGSCQIDLTALRAFAPLRHADADHRAESLEQSVLTWSFADGPLLLQVEAEPKALADCQLQVTSQRDNSVAPLPLGSAQTTGITSEDFATFAASVASDVSALVDLSPSDANFQALAQAVSAAGQLAAERKPWVDASGRLTVFTDEFLRDRLWHGDHRPSVDCLLCLMTGDGTSPAPQTAAEIPTREIPTRIVLLALAQRQRPALHWAAGTELPFGVAGESIRIEFDRLEGRWMLQQGASPPRELNPRGSQILELPLAPRWQAYFSGSLR